jgi:(p)ppGpp synthase/HD superfamily hydrolase
MIENVIKFLLDNDTNTNSHSGRMLIDHLMGTANLLREWECDENVVLAGLCHSIYGTDSYHTVTIDHSRREEVKNLIGEKAEHLAWEFGIRKNPRLYSFIVNKEIDLTVIECANLIEQKVEPHNLAAATAISLPKKVSEAVNKYLKNY